MTVGELVIWTSWAVVSVFLMVFGLVLGVILAAKLFGITPELLAADEPEPDMHLDAEMNASGWGL